MFFFFFVIFILSFFIYCYFDFCIFLAGKSCFFLNSSFICIFFRFFVIVLSCLFYLFFGFVFSFSFFCGTSVGDFIRGRVRPDQALFV